MKKEKSNKNMMGVLSKIVLVTLSMIGEISMQKIEEVAEFVTEKGQNIVKTLPSTPNKFHVLLSSRSDDFDFELKSLDFVQNKSWTESYRYLPQIRPIMEYDDTFFFSTKNENMIFDFEKLKPRVKLLNFSFKKFLAIFGEILYVQDKDDYGVIYNLQDQRVISRFSNPQEVKQERCTYAYFRSSIFCKISTKNQFLEIFIKNEKSEKNQKKIFLNFEGDRPFAYHNNRIFGCYMRLDNINCQLIRIETNTTSSFSIKKIRIFGRENHFGLSHLAVPEMKMLILALKNQTLNFHDIENKGMLLKNIDPKVDFVIRNMVFSNSSFILSVQFGEKIIKNFQLTPKFLHPNCLIYDYLVDECVRCDDNFILDFSNKRCFEPDFEDLPPAYTYTRGRVIKSELYKVEKIDNFFSLKIEISFEKWSKLEADGNYDHSLKAFLNEFSLKKNLKIFVSEFGDLDADIDTIRIRDGLVGLEKDKDCIFFEIFFKKSFLGKKVRAMLVTNMHDINTEDTDTNNNNRVLSRIFFTPENRFLTESEPNNSTGNTTDSKKRHHRPNSILKIFQEKISKSPEYYKEISIPTTIITSKSQNTDNNSKKYFFFKICNYIKIILTCFVYLKIASKRLNSLPKSNWLFSTIIKLQTLPYFTFIQIYTYRNFDRYQRRITEVTKNDLFLKIQNKKFFHKNFLKKFSEASYNLEPNWILGLIPDDQEYCITQNLGLIIYIILLFLSLFSVVVNRSLTKKISYIRLTTAKVILIDELMMTVVNIRLLFEENLFMEKFNLESFLLKSCLLAPLVILIDILCAFRSPEIKKDSIWVDFYPSSICPFYSFGHRKILKKVNELRRSFKSVQFFSYMNFLKFPILVFLIGFSPNSCVVTSLVFFAWSFVYFLSDIMTFGKYEKKQYFGFFRIFEGVLLLCYSVLALVCSIDQRMHYFPISILEIFSLTFSIIFNFLWIVVIFELFFIILDFALEVDFISIENKDKGFIVGQDNNPNNLEEVDKRPAGKKFNETEAEKFFREKIQKNFGGRFWMYFKSHLTQGSKKSVGSVFEQKKFKKNLDEGLSFLLQAEPERVQRTIQKQKKDRIESENHVKKFDFNDVKINIGNLSSINKPESHNLGSRISNEDI